MYIFKCIVVIIIIKVGKCWRFNVKQKGLSRKKKFRWDNYNNFEIYSQIFVEFKFFSLELLSAFHSTLKLLSSCFWMRNGKIQNLVVLNYSQQKVWLRLIEAV